MWYNGPVTRAVTGAFFISSAIGLSTEFCWTKRPLALAPAARVTPTARNVRGRFAMTAGDGKPCERCGTSAWYKGGNCIECQRRHNKKYLSENRERNRERCRKWYHENKEYARRKNREWLEQNPERKREADRQYYLRVRNTERYKRMAVKRATRWKKRHPIKSRTIMRRRRAREYAAEGDHTADEFKSLCRQYGNRCLRCGRADMKLTADHVVPLSRGGSNYISNIQPLCGPCNTSKHDKIIDYRTKPLPKRWIQPNLFEEQKS